LGASFLWRKKLNFLCEFVCSNSVALHSKIKINMKKIVLSICSLGVAFSYAQNIKVNTDRVLKSTTTLEMSGEQMGNEYKSDITTTSTLKITGADDKNYKATSTVTKMTMKSNAMGQDINFDSDKKEDMDGQMGQMMGKSVNQPTEVLISKETGDQKNVEEKADEGMGFMGGGSDKAGGVFYHLDPSKKVGDKWTITTDDAGIKTTKNYTLKSKNGNIAIVEVDFTAKGNTTKETMGQSMDMTIDTKGKSTMEVDTTTGIVKKNEADIDNNMVIEAMGQSIPMNNKMKALTIVE
jgi:hypothetical protein